VKTVTLVFRDASKEPAPDELDLIRAYMTENGRGYKHVVIELNGCHKPNRGYWCRASELQAALFQEDTDEG